MIFVQEIIALQKYEEHQSLITDSLFKFEKRLTIKKIYTTPTFCPKKIQKRKVSFQVSKSKAHTHHSNGKQLYNFDLIQAFNYVEKHH